MEAWRSSYTVEVWKGSYIMEAWKIVLMRCWVSSTIIDSYTVVVWRSSYTMEVWKGSYTMEAWKIVLIHCWVSSTIMTPRTRTEKPLHCASVEKVLYRGSMDNYADPLLGIKHYNGSYTM